MREEFKKLSLTGRLCYLFLCLEKYLLACYPDRDWTPVAKRCWQWTNVSWDEGCDMYAPVVPAYLLEFDSYEETNLLSFDGKLSEHDYFALVNLFAGITTGSEDDEINQILMLPIEFNNACECSDFTDANEPTLIILHKAQQFLLSNTIPLPPICKVKSMTVEEKHGWGEFLDSEYLSNVLTCS